MKKLLFLSLIILCTRGASAQTCQVHIQPNILATGGYELVALDTFGPQSTTYLWSTGETSQSIQVINVGHYCVTTTNQNQCTASDCFDWTITGNCSVEFHAVTDSVTGLQVYLATALPEYNAPWSFLWSNGSNGPSVPVLPGESLCVTAISPGGCIADTCVTAGGCSAGLFNHDGGSVLTAYMPAAASYLWSHGETSQEIHPAGTGYYCVTITNNAGCSSSNCLWYDPYIPPACGIVLTAQVTNTGAIQIEASPIILASPIVQYNWSNGSTTATLLVGEAGYYCLTATNQDGCTSEACYPVCAIDSAYVSILVADTTQNSFPAEVYVIQYDTTQGGTLIGIDTLLTDANGQLLITDLPDGPFLLKAALLPGTPFYGDYLPTYYSSSLLWVNAATLLSLSTPVSWIPCILPRHYIHMIAGENPGGPGFIGGLVSEGANFQGHGNGAESEGNPIPGVHVVLTLPDGTPVAVAVTNSEGKYEFPELAWGTYILTLDIPGIQPVEVSVVIGPGQPLAEGINFKVDNNSIALGTNSFMLENRISVSPNPTQDILTLETSQQVDVSLTDLQGKVYMDVFSAGPQTKISIGHLPAGVYFLSVYTGKKVQVIKVLKY